MSRQSSAAVAAKPRAGELQVAPALDVADRAPFQAPYKWNMVYLLARVFYEMHDRTEQALGPHNVTPLQFTILSMIHRWDGMSSAEMSRRFKVTPQSMGELIGNLEKRGLVSREKDPANRRSLRIALTDEGRRLVKLGDVRMREMELQLFQGFSPAELHDLRARLIDLHQQLGLSA